MKAGGVQESLKISVVAEEEQWREQHPEQELGDHRLIPWGPDAAHRSPFRQPGVRAVLI